MEKRIFLPRLITLGILLILAILLVLPNLTERELLIRFQDYRKDSTTKEDLQQEIEDFIVDRENGLGFFFPGKKCIIKENPTEEIALTETPLLDVPQECILKDSFITSVKINALIQNFPDLIDERETRLIPHPSEKLLSDILERNKELTIKLGLDLQGGMRVVLRADFESYIKRIDEKIDSLRKTADITNLEVDATDIDERISALTAERDLDQGRRNQLLNETKEILEKRLAAQNITEAELRSNIQSNSVSIDLPGVAKANEVLEKIKNTVSVEYRIVDEELTAKVSRDPTNRESLDFLKNQAARGKYSPKLARKILEDVAKRSQVENNKLFLLWRRAYGSVENKEDALLPREFRVLGGPELDGGDMESAFASPGTDGSGWYQITFRLTNFGAKKFGNLTKANKGKQLAILWGQRVISDPVIREPIYGGNGVINGNFNEDEAREIASVIREGALPMPLQIVSINTIGPTLGLDAIQSGIIAIVLSFIIVMIFLLFYYRWWGLNAILVIFLNILFLFAVMSFLGFTFTLPGFAGIVLTIGIAIDSSVIIFERVKEELRDNNSFGLAVEKAFQSSFWTILDANITTLIAAIILWLPKDGPIMGFAIVLFFGLLISMYTALTISRLFFDLIVRWQISQNKVEVVQSE